MGVRVCLWGVRLYVWVCVCVCIVLVYVFVHLFMGVVGCVFLVVVCMCVCLRVMRVMRVWIYASESARVMCFCSAVLHYTVVTLV